MPLEVEVGQHLLLPNGKRDFLVVVKAKSGPYLKIQYYNNDQTDKDKDLKLVWWRQNQGTNGEDYEEVYQDSLTSKQIRDGFAAWEEEIHVNLFYQRVLTDDAMSVTKKGRSLKRLQKAMVKRAKPLVPS